MKRKFSFGLAPVKVPPKTETKPEKVPTPSPRTPRTPRRERRDSISPPPSPFINRRPLSPKTEQQLRDACKLILHHFKPSGHVFEDQAKPKLDFDGPNRSMKEERAVATKANHHQQLTEVPKTNPNVTRQSHRHDNNMRDHSKRESSQRTERANTGRRREDQQTFFTEQEAKQASKSAKLHAHTKVVPIRVAMDSDDAESLQTPLTGSTDTHPNNASTAPTSVAVTSSRSSKRASHQFDNPAAVADAAAAEWMRQELEKRRMASPAQAKTSSRPPSRSRSIRSEIREYIFPGSTTISRTASRDSLRSSDMTDEPKRSSSSHGWRSWGQGLQRKTSLSSFRGSRPGSSRGRSETREPEAKKQELNLNRELPPLPSLDQWDKQEEKKKQQQDAKQPSQTQSTHIANLMRPRAQDQQEYAAAVRAHRRRSGSESMVRRASKNPELIVTSPPSRTVQSSHGPASPPQASSKHAKQDPVMNSDRLISSVDRTGDEENRTSRGAHHRTISSLSSPSMKVSMDHYRSEPPNFSRKISVDAIPHSPSFSYVYPNVVEITGATSAPKTEKSSKLRKAFSGWMLGGKKEKKGNWMDQVEQNGIKGGIMIQDEAALPPVVRY